MSTHPIRSFSHRRRLFGGDYIDRILALEPLAYWPMNETSGTTALNLGSLGTGANGTYTGVGLNHALGPDGVNGAPLWDGSNDYLNIETAPLINAWDAGGGEWTFLAWFKVYNSGMWTDGVNRNVLSAMDDTNNYLSIYKNSSNNVLTTIQNAGSTIKQVNKTSYNPTTWQHYALTRSETADELIPYINGSPVSTATTIGTWASASPWAKLLIGANTTTPTFVWFGWLAHIAMLNHVLTPAEVAAAATV